MYNAVGIFKNGLNMESIGQTLHGNRIRDLEHAYAVAQSMKLIGANHDQQKRM